MDLDAPNNRSVKAKKEEIDMEEAVPDYTGSDFIRLIVLAEQKEKSIITKIKSTTNDVENYKLALNNLLNKLDDRKDKLKIGFADINKLKSYSSLPLCY